MFDEFRMAQVLRNLLSNALRYGGESIKVELDSHNGQVCVVVSDDGRGIPPDEQERVFEPYHRAQPEDGLTAAIGVGLTVARRLARLMEGNLTYARVDGLSRFTFVLPAMPDKSIHAAEPSSPATFPTAGIDSHV